MAVLPSCPVLVVHEDDVFRKALIAALDREYFTVTFTADGEGAVALLRERRFEVVVVHVRATDNGNGGPVAAFLREARARLRCGVIILGEPDPQIREVAAWADETLLKPVDAAYVATRARTYCTC
ncbi:MAG: response regulator [Acidobacteria bacterium]|nr:response regulator [Acidobacteriota bacterium]